MVNYRSSKQEAEAVARSITSEGGKSVLVRGDVSDPKSVAAMFRTISRRVGGLDILVNNAGLSDPSIWNPDLGAITLEMWKRVFSVDVFGTFLCSQAASGVMGQGASIINIGSTPALAGDTEGLVYASGKGAVISMTKMLAQKLAPRVRVNCMIFGSFETTWVEWLNSTQLSRYRSSIPMKRLGRPTDAANLAVFLGSDDSSFVTGQSIVIDGGELMH